MEDARLIARCQSGDLAAFEALFQHHAPQVLRTAYLITRDRALAEEVMQEAFAQAFRTIGQLREARAFSSWLYRITVRQAQRVLRQERNQQTLLPPDQAASSPMADADRRRLIWEAMGQLPIQQRTALILHYYQDQPIAAIATLMGAPEGTVKSWLYRARTGLAAILGEDLPHLGGD